MTSLVIRCGTLVVGAGILLSGLAAAANRRNAAPAPRSLPGSRAEIYKKIGDVEPELLSPYHHVRKGQPPTIIFHGQNDTTVPYFTSELFAEKMKANANRCELVGYPGQSHGFFNYGRDGNKYFVETVKKMDAFLVALGYLKGPDQVETFFRQERTS